MNPKKKRRRSPFAWLSDSALRTAGFRKWEGLAGQAIPHHFAVKSIVLMSVYGLAAGFFAMWLFAVIVALFPIGGLPPIDIIVAIFAGCSVLAATLQAIRIARLNQKTQRHRIATLERQANKQLAVQ